MPENSPTKRSVTSAPLLEPAAQAFAGAADTRPHPLELIVYLHHAGWLLGDHQTHDRLIGQMATRTGIAAVFAKFSRAREERYPTTIDKSYAALRIIAGRGDRHGSGGSRIAVTGESRGATMAAAALRWFWDQCIPDAGQRSEATRYFRNALTPPPRS